MKKIYKNIITAITATLLCLVLPWQSSAQESLDLSISPPVAYLKAAPGTEQVHIIALKNNSASKVLATPKIVDFTLHPDTGAPVLLESNSFPYFSMPPSALKPTEIDPGQVAQLQLKIDPPATAEDKEYPLSIVFTVENLDSITGDATIISGAVSSNLIVLISDKNKLEKELMVEDFGVPGVIDSFRGVTAEPVLKNERFNTSAASGSAKLVSWTGKAVAEYQIYPDNVLGFNSRKIRALDSSGTQPAPAKFKFDSAFMIGPYRLFINLDNDGTQSIHTKTVVAVPFSIFVAAAIGGIVGAIYWYKIRKENSIRL